MFKSIHLLLASIAVLVFSSQSLLAQNYSPYSSYGYGNYYPYGTANSQYYGSGTSGAYRSPYAYGSPYSYSAPAARPGTYGSTPGYNYRAPYSGTSSYAYRAPQQYAYRPTPNYRSPYGYGYRPWYRKKKNDGFFDEGPFSGGDFAEELWPGERDNIWEEMAPIDGPWSRDWGKAPWNRDYADMYGDEGGPTKWFDWDDPKEGVAVMWEDALYSPHALGTMPGGWDAPTVVVPNPIDVGDEFKDASTDFPGEMKDFADGFTYGDRTITGSKAGSNPNAGGFGVGGNKGNKKKDGINIETKPRR